MKHTKKLLSMLLALVMVLSILPASVSAAGKDVMVHSYDELVSAMAALQQGQSSDRIIIMPDNFSWPETQQELTLRIPDEATLQVGLPGGKTGNVWTIPENISVIQGADLLLAADRCQLVINGSWDIVSRFISYSAQLIPGELPGKIVVNGTFFPSMREGLLPGYDLVINGTMLVSAANFVSIPNDLTLGDGAMVKNYRPEMVGNLALEGNCVCPTGHAEFEPRVHFSRSFMDENKDITRVVSGDIRFREVVLSNYVDPNANPSPAMTFHVTQGSSITADSFSMDYGVATMKVSGKLNVEKFVTVPHIELEKYGMLTLAPGADIGWDREVCNAPTLKGSGILRAGADLAENTYTNHASVTLYAGPDRLDPVSLIDDDSAETLAVRGQYIDSTVRLDRAWMDDNVVPEEPEQHFSDVKSGQWFAENVQWAVDNKITDGFPDGTFKPNQDCTRAQIVTFLWRAAGKPEPAAKSAGFSDVKPGSWYEKAVLWAVENKITDGFPDGTFLPNAFCTRAQAVTFLYRNAGKPQTSTESPFGDVTPGWYYNAVVWAVENDITDGFPDGSFKPDQDCTRAQIVTFLRRCEKN